MLLPLDIDRLSADSSLVLTRSGVISVRAGKSRGEMGFGTSELVCTVGTDPNPTPAARGSSLVLDDASQSDEPFRNAKRYNLDGEHGHSVRCVHGIGEALPVAAGSVDAVVSTLTLCSVPNVERSLAEVRRVLKPGGQFLFLEHVKSETDEKLAAVQEFLNPQQVARADGCNLNRRTLQMIKAANFASLDAEYFELTDFYVLNPTVAGIARM